MRLLAALVLLLCCLDLTASYSISLLEQTITIAACNVSVVEVITVQPDLMQNITTFTRDIDSDPAWQFSSLPTRSVTLPSDEVTFPITGQENIITIDFLVPPSSAFNVTISYAFTNLIESKPGNLTNENSFAWTVRPPAGINITGTGLLFVAVFRDADEASAIVDGSIFNGTTQGNDSYVAYALTPVMAGTILSIGLNFQSESACLIKRHVRDLAPGAVAGIVLGTLSGTVLLLVSLNLICGYFTPAPPRRV